MLYIQHIGLTRLGTDERCGGFFRDSEISLLSNSQPRATLAAPKNSEKPKCAKSEKEFKNQILKF